MKLYLVRHGIPEKGAGDDPPLSERGRTDLQRLGSFLARSGLKVKRVIHSPLIRARETALILAPLVCTFLCLFTHGVLETFRVAGPSYRFRVVFRDLIRGRIPDAIRATARAAIRATWSSR